MGVKDRERKRKKWRIYEVIKNCNKISVYIANIKSTNIYF
jgi:hypothetical protein